MFNYFKKPEVRQARRMGRIKRWDAPLVGPWARIKAHVNMLFVDHGIIRALYLNCHQVTDRFWRSGQPAPRDIDRIARLGVRTIVNLRGGREHGSWPLEREACERNGLILEEFIVRSRDAPSKDTLLAAKEFFASLNYPILVHCKAGADRAGFMSVLYLIVHEEFPVDEAMKQLSMRYGHFRFSKTGILDAFFELYKQEGEAQGMDFMTWVSNVYDPEKLKATFRSSMGSSLLADYILRRE